MFYGITDLSAFILGTIFIVLLPGPNSLYVMTVATRHGIAAGYRGACGIFIGDTILMILSVAGVATLLKTNPGAFAAVQWLGAAYLAWLGWKMLSAKPGDAPVLNIRPRQYFQQALAITLLNPKAIVFYMAFFPLFVDPKHHLGLTSFAVMAATVAVLTFLYGLGMTLLTHHLAERMRANPRIGRVLEKLAGVFLIGFGIKLAVSK